MKLGKYDIVALYSGGLDSKLACKLLANQGLSVLAIKFLHPFSPGPMCNKENFYKDNELSVDVLELPTNEEYLKIILQPKHGYGKNANPCLDCKIHFFKRALEICRRVDAKGIASGEVLGQRPFSQRREAMKLIEKNAGVEGKVVRPLCAKLLKPSLPEISGSVDRNSLLDIRGRGRKRQMQLAKELGIKNYPSPAGGCLLTDPGYAAKFFEAKDNGEIFFETTQLIKFGRHFRINGSRVVVGRNRGENEVLENIFAKDRFLIVPIDISGPSALVDGAADDNTIEIAGTILARYIKKVRRNVLVKMHIIRNGTIIKDIESSPADPTRIEPIS